MLAKMKASAEQDIEKKTPDLKPVLITERKFSVYDKKEKDNVTVSDKSRNSITVPAKRVPPKVPQPRGSLSGMLATKKFFKRLSKKQRAASTVSVPAKQYEPTYRMEPKVHYNEKTVYDIVKELIDEKLEGMIYSKKYSGNLTKIISNQIKEKVKALHYDRYRIVCNVMLGENRGATVLATSRCAWDPKTDNFTSYSFQSKHLFCNVSVFAVYKE
ncbi:dynein light chain Tctex-type protein 2B-like [Ostrea edulis]|uniref:dynein light chain Tctex-type protein 2B-like n=1 Tax=Ostrea edulis TaxID=37623 RepID=UPI0020963487|nr:dynein light chain Tctex-type protein 2B-like [Ostrea edulis]XP_048760126.1 dynein light chain Tctex-type protein 2B-like [Ostrea edulis]XP_056018574.1 dynein light chain Tctex-type protein 2B-like [Ostrea edulis]XP_056018575.1 dynein light chain Tctex-type protein 2B-like [Ostrea edulis]